MAITTDKVLSTNEIIDLLINGDETFDGLETRVATELTDLDFEVIAAYPDQELGVYETRKLPLEKAIISVYDMGDVEPGQFFKGHVLPNGGNGFGWKREPEIRWDVWARTPPESRTLTDVLRKQLIKAARELWQAYRIGLIVSRAYEVPIYYEVLEVPVKVYHKYIDSVVRTIETIMEEE